MAKKNSTRTAKAKPAKKAAPKKTAPTPKRKATGRNPDARPPVPIETLTDAQLRERQQYDEHRKAAGLRQRNISRSGRDIGQIPPPIDPRLKESLRHDLKKFGETCFPRLFNLAWSKAHDKVIAKLEDAILNGGQFALAMPRGSGKTTLSLVALIWSVVYGHRSYAVLIAATGGKAEKLAKIVKRFLSTLGTPFADLFPEVVVPCAELENRANRASGQLHRRQPTGIEWGADQIVLATLRPLIVDDQEAAPAPPGDCYGSVIATAGLTGEIRGMLYARGDELIRPDFVILDDPQTKSSARSQTETQFRLEVIDEDVLGLAGPDETLSVVMPCTVIEENDLADQLLDDERNPDWQGERIPMLISFPKDLSLWDEYRELLIAAKRNKNYKDANKFYKAQRKKLDAGAEHYWPQRLPTKYAGLSAIQFAMDWFLTRPKSFWSECQQKPEGDAPPDADLLTAEEISEKQHNEDENTPPADADIVVAFIDVQGELLFYTVAAFNLKTFTGYVIRYGSWPEQSTRNFTLSGARKTLSKKYTGQRGGKLSLENVIRKAVDDLTDWLLAQTWTKQDGQGLKIQRLAIDGGWKTKTIRESVAARRDPRVLVAFGRDSRLTGQDQPGDRKAASGDWRARTDIPNRVRFITIVPNPWKTFCHARLATDIGEAGSLSLFRDDPFRHDTYARHQRAEHRKRKLIDGADVDFWTLPPSKPDNHWHDTLVGCCVLADHEGATLWTSSTAPGARRTPAQPKKKSAARKRSKVSYL